MVTNALIVGFVVALAKFLDWYGLGNQLARPIFIVPILGLCLGDLSAGIILGAQLELIFLGNVSLGGVMPSDVTLGAIFGAGFAIILKMGTDSNAVASAVALAVPISLLGTLLYSIMKMIITAVLVPKFEKFVENRKMGNFNRLWVAQFVGFELVYFLLGFIVILAGAAPVGALIKSIPDWVQASMSVAATMLPAVGLALLLKMLWQKSLAPYFFLGFGMGAFMLYTKSSSGTIVGKVVNITGTTTPILSLVQIAFFGIVIAAIVMMSEMRHSKAEQRQAHTDSTATNTEDDLEDFFDE
ncbi:PTS sugar transporter subunit IIC [Lactococcus lactis]|uniref:PTS mannose/fructose/sorbose/N-acetylgalactosamine transporter subunit IIC n=1 Tax=Lactococcus lactis TaxID=1358 RepID=UPI0021A4C861|nr:PTS sugar transporter subunit IIC [Lactococcus lactis]MCT3091786.1 PTS sugar transporter subunit IIC [Lactococcus lactis]